MSGKTSDMNQHTSKALGYFFTTIGACFIAFQLFSTIQNTKNKTVALEISRFENNYCEKNIAESGFYTVWVKCSDFE